MLSIKVFRYKKSLDYRGGIVPTPGMDLWHVNDKHNSLDFFEVLDEGSVIFHCLSQTVSNMEGLDPDVHFTDTIKPGPFMLRAFVDPRQHQGRVHGICRTYTMAGDYINADSTTEKNKLRWLCHDYQKLKPNKGDTRVAWSAGCIIIADKDLDSLGVLFDGHGITSSALITGELIQEE
jgi:hypothetical protein